LRKLLGGGLERLATHTGQAFLHVLGFQRFGDFRVELRHDVFGRTSGRKHAVPRRGAKALDRLANGGGIGQGRQALGVDHAQHLHLARADESDRRGQALHRHLHLPGHQIGGSRRGALVGHMGHVDAGGFAQHFTDQVVERAVAGRADVDFAGLLLGHGDQFGCIFGGEHGIGHQDIASSGDRANRLEILDGVKTRVLVEGGVDDHGAVGGDEQRVAIWPGACSCHCAHIATGAGAVVHHERLAGLLNQFLCDHTCNRVVGTAGGVRHDDGDRLGREFVLRQHGDRDGQRQAQGQNGSAWLKHEEVSSLRIGKAQAKSQGVFRR